MVVPDQQYIFSMAKKPMELSLIDIVGNRSHATGLVQECLAQITIDRKFSWWPEMKRRFPWTILVKDEIEILIKNYSKKKDFLERKKRLKDKDYS